MNIFELKTYFVDQGIYNVTKGKFLAFYWVQDLKSLIDSSINQKIPMPEEFKIFDILPFSDKYKPRIYFIYSEFVNHKLTNRLFIRHFGFAIGYHGYTEYEYQNLMIKNTIKKFDIDKEYLDLQSLNIISEYIESYEEEYREYGEHLKDLIVIVDSHKIYSETEFELVGTLEYAVHTDEMVEYKTLFGHLDTYIKIPYVTEGIPGLYELMNITDMDMYGFYSDELNVGYRNHRYTHSAEDLDS